MTTLRELLEQTDRGAERLAVARLKRDVLLQLDDALADAGITQAELGKRLGKSRSAVNQVLSGDGNVRIETLAQYLHAMGKEVVLTQRPTRGGAERAKAARLRQSLAAAERGQSHVHRLTDS